MSKMTLRLSRRDFLPAVYTAAIIDGIQYHKKKAMKPSGRNIASEEAFFICEQSIMYTLV